MFGDANIGQVAVRPGYPDFDAILMPEMATRCHRDPRVPCALADVANATLRPVEIPAL